MTWPAAADVIDVRGTAHLRTARVLAETLGMGYTTVHGDKDGPSRNVVSHQTDFR